MSDSSDSSSEESYNNNQKATNCSDSDENSQASPNKRKLVPVNNVAGLQQKCDDILLNFDWIEKLDVVVKNPFDEAEAETTNETSAENDFKREMNFYNQALEGVTKAFKQLRKLGVSTKRPIDYYAEMAKSDVHMQKVRQKLLSKQTAVERVEKVRAIREQKKQGKKIQREIIQQRKQEKKKMITALKKTKKGKMDASKLLGEDKPKTPKKGKRQKSREFRDNKYGYGGKKKGSKYNTADSSAEGLGNKPKGKHFGGPKPQFGKKRSKHIRRRR